MTPELPTLRLPDWQPTRDTLHQYTKIAGRIRGHYMPKSKHWWHITLMVSARGLTTTPFPVGRQNLEIVLDLTSHQLRIDSSNGWTASLSLLGQSSAGLCRALASAVAAGGITLDQELLEPFHDETVLPYDADAVSRYRRVVNWVDSVFKEFKGGLREESGPVQIFPHHMDVSINWFSGRRVPGADPADEENADEHMNFGFVTGDGSIADAYFYATAYPAPDGWTGLSLPEGAYWHTKGWIGAVLPYAALRESPDPRALLLDYLRSARDHGALSMR